MRPSDALNRIAHEGAFVGSVVLPAADASERTSEVNADASWSGSCRPRFAARFKIPFAARGESENLGDTCFCRTADKEHSTATLGDSEITAVQNSVSDSRPALP